MRPASLHPYVYVENDPLNWSDPRGLQRFRIWTAAFIQPARLHFFYQKAKGFVGEWEGDGRDFYDLTGVRPSSRIWAEVTVDTQTQSGYISGSNQSGVKETVVHYVDWHNQRQTDRDLAPDEAHIRVARDGPYILVRIKNRGSNPLTPPGTPPIIYDYNVVFDLAKQRVIVGGDTGAFPSHEIRIDGVGWRGSHPNYAGGANPSALALPASTFGPIEAALPIEHVDVCLAPPNPSAWYVLDGRYIMQYLPLVFPDRPWQ